MAPSSADLHATALSRMRPPGQRHHLNSRAVERRPIPARGDFPVRGLLCLPVFFSHFNIGRSTMSNTNQDDRVKNVITTGFGFINRIRQITPKSGQPYIACNVALMHGVGDNVDHVRIDCTVRGQKALDVVRRHFTSPQGEVKCPENTTVMASMTLGGLTPYTFEYTKGEKAGKTGVGIRSTLLGIKWLKIGDNVVETEPGQAAEGDTATPAQPAAAQTGEPAFVQELRNEYGQNGFVRLSKEHPEFEERKQFLKDNGFTWDKENKVWV
ncbi:MAG: DUF3577 domain-containing protein, partial [Gammaproteobacteria bacterium]|nr:DUF3577 domain-containing protein [Gammaproteobacteria bacterium]